jgi:hypothetical protein
MPEKHALDHTCAGLKPVTGVNYVRIQIACEHVFPAAPASSYRNRVRRHFVFPIALLECNTLAMNSVNALMTSHNIVSPNITP